jgi:myosin-crossreactive antigen
MAGGDVSFTVESSVRTAMMAVWGLTGLQKPQVPMYEPIYDVRVIAKSLEMAVGSDVLNLGVLDKVKSATAASTAKLLDAALGAHTRACGLLTQGCPSRRRLRGAVTTSWSEH